MPDIMTPDKIKYRCGQLKSKWTIRNKRFKDWYEILRLKDELAQDGMESVTSNDPRTGYNLGRHLLKSAIIAHKIDQEDLLPQEIAGITYLETYWTKYWRSEDARYRSLGKQGWLWYLVSLLMATGWYAVFSMVEQGSPQDRIYSEIWSPAETFPDFGADGISEVAHIYPLTASAANRKFSIMGVKPTRPFTVSTTCYDYHFFDADGAVANSIVIGSEFLKPPTQEPELSKLGRLPVFISPVGGLPDMGSIDAKWQEHFGEAVVATNEDLTKNYNKMLTYTQQLVRDTANPRWLELSNSESGILRPEDLFKRGGIFKGQPGDVVSPLPAPPIPVELRQAIFDYQNMLQRGSFPWSNFGNVQQQMSYLAMAQVASSSMQVLSPYVDAVRGLLSDIDNYQWNMIKENGSRPKNFTMPKNLPEEFYFDVQADIEIPGYLIQRATVARMLDPTFRLSTTTVMDRLFPEVRNPLKEQANARKDVALNNPKAILADSILAYREQALVMRDAGDADGAQLYEKLAQSMEAELIGQPTQPRTVVPTTEVPREVLPERELTPPPEELGA